MESWLPIGVLRVCRGSGGGGRYEAWELVDESLQLLEAGAKGLGRGLCGHDEEGVGHSANEVWTFRDESPEEPTEYRADARSLGCEP